MNQGRTLRAGLVLCLLLLVIIVGTSGVAAASPGSPPPGMDATTPETLGVGSEDLGQQAISAHSTALNDQDEAAGEEFETEDEDEDRATLLGDWWGLGGEAQETPYVGLVELGVVVLTLGLGGYLLGKRASVVPPQYRRYLLPAHEWSMLLGTALTVPHFLAVEEWEGLGFAVGVLLGIEVVSGVYGRHLHRHVIRLERGHESASIVGNVLSLSKRTVFSRWRWVHRSLTVVTAVVLVLHIVTAIGD